MGKIPTAKSHAGKIAHKLSNWHSLTSNEEKPCKVGFKGWQDMGEFALGVRNK